jgi:hypothetical protein
MLWLYAHESRVGRYCFTLHPSGKVRKNAVTAVESQEK